MSHQQKDGSVSRIYHSDLKGFYCNKHSRLFYKKHGLDWWDFVKNGIEREKLESLDDQLVKNLLDHVDSKHGQKQ